MLVRTIVITSVAFAALGAFVFAQTSPSTSNAAGRSPPVQSTPGQTSTINLNTATAAELVRLPRVGAGGVAAIIGLRAKSSFKNWDDFVSRRVVPPFAEKEIKGLVTF
ncbi:ComEA family DNA-binding protein [Bradyrhizobium sp. SZCCHNS1054]|uniref:ComEA family DNA-binding protein n=1 Tax=unclassified Bradyrhizobium TaxID=2631580 RepID=UPI0029170923|nr:helix-hairpin-helix domain-containing protein [Bradyrhizobium sp. SZCCHNS1054]